MCTISVIFIKTFEISGNFEKSAGKRYTEIVLKNI